jgi:hypothetical protein
MIIMRQCSFGVLVDRGVVVRSFVATNGSHRRGFLPRSWIGYPIHSRFVSRTRSVARPSFQRANDDDNDKNIIVI